MQVQLRAERAAVSLLEEDVQVYKTEAASTQQNISELKEKNNWDGDMENKAGKTHIIELALSACAHAESRTDVGQLQHISDWVGWMGDHLPYYMLHQHCPHIVAAVLLRAYWCVKFGDSLPFGLARAINSKQHGHANGLPFPELVALMAMQFLNISAADCRQATKLHSKFVVRLARSPPRGLPWKTQA